MKISKKRFVTEWIKDLRSGKFRKTTKRLYNDGCYCALGVACKTGERLGIPDAAFVKPSPLGSEYTYTSNFRSQTRKDYTPGEWFEDIMGEGDPVLKTDSDKVSVSELNDNFGYSFKEIADCLEHTFLKRK